MELTPILTVAAKELRDRLRNRWVLAVALVFAVFSLVIAYFGGAQLDQVADQTAGGKLGQSQALTELVGARPSAEGHNRGPLTRI